MTLSIKFEDVIFDAQIKVMLKPEAQGHEALLFLAGYVRILGVSQDDRLSSSCNLVKRPRMRGYSGKGSSFQVFI